MATTKPASHSRKTRATVIHVWYGLLFCLGIAAILKLRKP